MTFRFQWLLAALMLFLASPVPADQYPPQAELQVFVREGCPHCADAKAFLPSFAKERPWLNVVFRPLDTDPTARDDLEKISRQKGVWPPGVPTFVMGERILVGFVDAAHSGPVLATLVDEHAPLSWEIKTETLGTLSASRLGLPLFTLALGLLDGFNPCAMWVLLFLLSMLVHFHDRKRMTQVAGTFVLVSGVIYFLFMAAWLNVFLLIGISKTLWWVLAGVGLIIGIINVRDFLKPQRGFVLSIPDSAKPGLYARMRAVISAHTLLPSLLGVASLAVVVNFIELLCTAGIPAIYTAVLAQQMLEPWMHYAYLGLYILGYIADDTLMVVAAVTALSSNKLSERTGRWLKLLSGIVMLFLAGLMFMAPDRLI